MHRPLRSLNVTYCCWGVRRESRAGLLTAHPPIALHHWSASSHGCTTRCRRKQSGITPYAAPYALCMMLMAAHTSRFHGRERLVKEEVVVVVVCVVVLVEPMLACAVAWVEP